MPKSKSRRSKKSTTKRKPSSRANAAPAAAGSKTAFVTARPNQTAQQVVADAAQHGITLTVGYVYNIRAMAKKKADAGGGGGRDRAMASDAGIEPQFRMLVLRIGLDRAEKILSDIRTAFSFTDGRSPPPRRPASRSESLTSSDSDAASEVPAQPSA
jgi:hypothetical protein